MPADRQDIATIRNIAELDPYAEDWDHLAGEALRFFPCYAEARVELERSSFLAAVRLKRGRAIGLACFLHQRAEQVFAVGERRLFSLPAMETRLYGGAVLGDFDEQSLSDCLVLAFNEWPCHLLTLGEVERGSELHRASQRLRSGIMRTRRQRKDPIRWLISLPPTFDEYLAQLRTSTRKSVSYTLRRLERELSYTHEIVTRPEQVERFLRDGESVSRKTYQWNVGQRLVDDEPTRQHYLRLAREGRLRCHMLYVDGEPCAFSRGELSGHAYRYETPGFVTEFHKYSLGVVLLMWTIQDLIANTSCTVFDFGEGGDDHGYKSRFGTRSVQCTDLQFAILWRPYSALLLTIYLALSLAKNVASTVIGATPMRQRLKKAIRVHPAAMVDATW